MSQRPLADGLYRLVDGAPRLLGGRRKSDGKLAFPLPQGAQGELYEPVELSSDGVLWSYTVQRFRPKTPYAGPGDDKSFRPYAVGYVELPGQIIVESHIATTDFNALRIGQPMRLTLMPFRREPDGTDVMIYGFKPATQTQEELTAS
ncbi:MAG TPA: OB-fold domain-containing protein [Caulobacteraceae bacterium]|nr:OB-fold domain-containing protein [Caulobacteraceae bacterium]